MQCVHKKFILMNANFIEFKAFKIKTLTNKASDIFKSLY